MSDDRTRWNDSRLDELERRVRESEQAVRMVGRLEERMDGFGRGMERLGKAVEELTKKLGELTLEPFTRGRRVREQLGVALLSATVGGGLAMLAVVLAGSH